MLQHTDSTPTAMWSAFVAPALDGLAAGVCPQVRFRGEHAAALASVANGRRPWSPLIT